MLTVHNKKQIILEGCCFKNNFKVIATWNYVLNDYVIDIRYTQFNRRPKLYTFFDIYNRDCNLDKDIFIKIYVKLCKYES